MRKYTVKRELSYHEGAYSAITEIIYCIDKLYTVLQDYIPTPNKGQKNDK